MLPIAIASTAILLLSLGLVVLVSRLGSDKQVLPVTTDWLGELSTDRYRPMLRMLDDADFRFLRGQGGFTPKLASRLRHQRAQAFRGYLRLLQADFDRVAVALQVIMANSAHDRPDLAFVLFQRRVKFACGMLGVQIQVGLFCLGLSGGDVSDLLQLFDGMRLELRMLVPSSSFAVA